MAEIGLTKKCTGVVGGPQSEINITGGNPVILDVIGHVEMDAIITDIHGNLEALNAVLGAIRESSATRIICLGDLVCYGPDSTECVRLSNDWDIVLLGD